jgi:hypothetical protein
MRCDEIWNLGGGGGVCQSFFEFSTHDANGAHVGGMEFADPFFF